MLKTLLAIVVSATLDSTTLFIGDQVNLTLQATIEQTDTVQMPVYGEQLIQDVEIVNRTGIDTTILNDGRLQLTEQLTITSFKDSLFYIPGLPVVAAGDTFRSNPLTLNVVQPFEIDTALAITPIKGIYKAPIWWKGIIVSLLLILLIAGLIVFLFYASRKWNYLLKKKKAEPETEPELLRPAEEVALEKLEVIREQKIWQQGKVKEYYTDLTDVVREYISRRYDIRSTEKTSDETLRAIKQVLNEADQKTVYDSLRQMLQLADLVKFAKWNTTPSENERSLTQAYSFVHETTPVATPADNDNNLTSNSITD
ncbi:MAG: hypothetical protein IJS00_05755 [Paludibacteraceae bacterium]|nr:hypothetical protein [Paludibacteraceae bacterium]